MSSGLCKKVECAVFPFQVKSLEDGVNDSIHALHVDKADHGPGAAPEFHEAALDDVGGAQFAPKMPGETKEGQHLRQVSFQLPNHAGIALLPMPAEAPASSLGLFAIFGLIDGLSFGFDLVVLALFDFLQDVTHLIHPAALMLSPRIDGRDG